MLLSDLWSPIEEIRSTLTQLSTNGAQGHLVQIVDPAEETFPYSGRVEFIEPEGGGEITAGRAENLARRLRGAARNATAPKSAPRPTGSAGASPSTAPTAPPTELLLALHARIGEGNEAVATNRRPRGMPLGRPA